MGNAAMQQAETFPHDGIARSSEPAHLLFRQSVDIAPQGVDEQGLRELGEHGFAADASRSCFFDQVQDGILEPVPGAIGSDVDRKNGRKSAEYRATEVRVASHVSTNESRNF